MFILYGTGANGKSTFLNVIQNILGDYALSAWAETFMKRNNDTATTAAIPQAAHTPSQFWPCPVSKKDWALVPLGVRMRTPGEQGSKLSGM
jgi:hypothetical protein